MRVRQVLSTAGAGLSAAAFAASTIGAATQPPATKPADPVFEAVPAGLKAELTPKLRAAASQAQTDMQANLESAARKTLESAIADVLTRLDPASDPAVVLRTATDDAQRAANARTAVERLQGGITEAIYAMDFKPVMEAPLPDGYPGPGPVAKVVVKEYPAYRLARTPMKAGDQNAPFMTLFRHIQANDIAMTAPVEMTYTRATGDGKAANEGKAANKDGRGGEQAGEARLAAARVAPESMAFLYRSTTQGEVGSKGSVEVVDLPAMTVASVGVRGTYTDARMGDALAKIDRWLADHASGYERAGDPRYLGYNSPFVLPWMRYGEVQVPIRRK